MLSLALIILGQGINALTLASSLTNSNLNKISSTLGSINTSIDRQKNTLDDIADSLSKSRYEQPGKGKDFASGSSDLGRIGPSLENKSASQEKTEDDLKHNIMEALKEGIVKAGEMALGVWGGLKIGGAGAAGAATPLVEGAAGAATAEAGGSILSGATLLGGAQVAGGLAAGTAAAVGAPVILNQFKKQFPNVHARFGESPNLTKENIIDPNAHLEDFLTNDEMKDWNKPHEPAKDVFERMRHSQEKKPVKKPHSIWETFQREFGIAPAEGKESLEPVQESALSKANPEVVRTDKPERTDKPVQVAAPNVAVDSKGSPSTVSIEGENITLNVGGESFARVLEKAFKGMLLGAGAGAIIPGIGTGIGAATGGFTGIGKGILDEFRGKDFERLKDQFKEGQKRAEESNTPQGRAEQQRRFQSGPLQQAIDALNGKQPYQVAPTT